MGWGEAFLLAFPLPLPLCLLFTALMMGKEAALVCGRGDEHRKMAEVEDLLLSVGHVTWGWGLRCSAFGCPGSMGQAWSCPPARSEWEGG